jgi:hypothetical protein
VQCRGQRSAHIGRPDNYDGHPPRLQAGTLNMNVGGSRRPETDANYLPQAPINSQAPYVRPAIKTPIKPKPSIASRDSFGYFLDAEIKAFLTISITALTPARILLTRISNHEHSGSVTTRSNSSKAAGFSPISPSVIPAASDSDFVA